MPSSARTSKPTRVPHELFDASRGLVQTAEASDSTASFAVFGDFGLSMRIHGPFRMTAEGTLGATTSRLVVRDRGTHAAYWGQPYGALALRKELMFE